MNNLILRFFRGENLLLNLQHYYYLFNHFFLELMQKKNRIEKKLLIKKLRKMTVATNLSKEHEELEDEVNHPGDVIDDDDDPDKLAWIHMDIRISV